MRPVTIVVPFVAGGTTDIVTRIVAQPLSERLGQPVVVENVGGAGGNLGAGQAAKATADGYTVFMATVAHTMAPGLYKKLSRRAGGRAVLLQLSGRHRPDGGLGVWPDRRHHGRAGGGGERLSPPA